MKRMIYIRYSLFFFLLAFVGCRDECHLDVTSFDGSWSFYCEGMYLELGKDGEQFDLFTEVVFQTSFNEFVVDENNCIVSILLCGKPGYRFKVETLGKNKIKGVHLATGEKVVFNRIGVELPIYSKKLMIEKKDSFWNFYQEGFQMRMLEFYNARHPLVPTLLNK